ncbi:VCBS repeat-containing protein, partial [Verrucomicrobiales bacterium]|nr:VCBS repeat-containing protein [Verrucomicrobiales bacterium]
MKKILSILGVVVVAIVAFLLILMWKDSLNPYDVAGCDYSVPEGEIPTFTGAHPDFTNKFDGKAILPFLGSTLIDLDGDGTDEIFFGAGVNQKNALFKFDGAKFVDISEQSGLLEVPDGTTYGAVSYDLDDNGQTDLILTRPDGVWFLANDGGKFTSSRLPIEVDEKSSPFTVTLGDYDKDGLADIFLCCYLQVDKMEGQNIFNKHNYGANSILLKNKGGLKFEDVTDASGMRFTHNTFQGIFVDLDDDGWLDLAVAY